MAFRRTLHAGAAVAVPLALQGCGDSGPTPTPTKSTTAPPSQDTCDSVEVQCSPEICDISGEGQTVLLEDRTYYINKQVVLPKGTNLIGAGIGKTSIQACGERLTRGDYCRNKNECRRGFILTDNTYVSGFTFSGRDVGRWGDNDCLFGGAPLETPGCQDSYCRPNGDAECGIEGVNVGMDFCTAGGCEGVSNVTAEDIEVEAYTAQSVVWVPLNPPGNRTCSNLTFRRLSTSGVWADGVNIHGEHSDVLVEDSVIENTGDDGFAMWSNGDKLTNVVFKNNTMKFPRCCNRVWEFDPKLQPTFYPAPALDCSNGTDVPVDETPNWGVNCFAMYGGGAGNKLLDNHCVSTFWGFMAFHDATPGDLGFHGNFSADAVVTLSGNTVASGADQGPSCCTGSGAEQCPICYWRIHETGIWQQGMRPQIDGGDCAPPQALQL